MKKKLEFITKEYLDKTLDKRFSEQTGVIIEALAEYSADNKSEHQRIEAKIDKGLEKLGIKWDGFLFFLNRTSANKN